MRKQRCPICDNYLKDGFCRTCGIRMESHDEKKNNQDKLIYPLNPVNKSPEYITDKSHADNTFKKLVGNINNSHKEFISKHPHLTSVVSIFTMAIAVSCMGKWYGAFFAFFGWIFTRSRTNLTILIISMIFIIFFSIVR